MFNLSSISADLDIAADREAIEVSAFAESRTQATQAVAFDFYLKPRLGVPQRGHQFAFSCRPASENVVMPSRATLEATGNAYSLDDLTASHNKPSAGYEHHKYFVVAHHFAFAKMLSGEAMSASDLFYDNATLDAAQAYIAERDKAFKGFARKSFDKNAFAYGLLHMLHELEACGLIVWHDAKRNSKSKASIQPALIEAIEAARQPVETVETVAAVEPAKAAEAKPAKPAKAKALKPSKAG